MNDTTSSLPSAPMPARSEALRTSTNQTHERLDQTIMRSKPFDSVENYTRFLRVQHAFHRDVAPLYADPVLAALIPDLASLGRYDQVRADLAALGGVLDDVMTTAPAAEGLPIPEAFGWLYVVEGSNLGAAILYKAALKMGLSETHGASHLAAAPEGRAAHWRHFKEALNAVNLSPEEETCVIVGAEAAFAQVYSYTRTYLPDPVEFAEDN